MGVVMKRFYIRDDEGKLLNVFQRSMWTDFIRDVGLEQALVQSGYRSPKNFVKERYMEQWIVYKVTKRLED